MNKLLILILLCFSFNAYSEQKFNPYNNEWKRVSPDAELKYNPFSNSHEYVPPDAVPRFNAYSGEYEMASPDASARNTILIKMNTRWFQIILNQHIIPFGRTRNGTPRSNARV